MDKSTESDDTGIDFSPMPFFSFKRYSLSLISCTVRCFPVAIRGLELSVNTESRMRSWPKGKCCRINAVFAPSCPSGHVWLTRQRSAPANLIFCFTNHGPAESGVLTHKKTPDIQLLYCKPCCTWNKHFYIFTPVLPIHHLVPPAYMYNNGLLGDIFMTHIFHEI